MIDEDVSDNATDGEHPEEPPSIEAREYIKSVMVQIFRTPHYDRVIPGTTNANVDNIQQGLHSEIDRLSPKTHETCGFGYVTNQKASQLLPLADSKTKLFKYVESDPEFISRFVSIGDGSFGPTPKAALKKIWDLHSGELETFLSESISKFENVYQDGENIRSTIHQEAMRMSLAYETHLLNALRDQGAGFNLAHGGSTKNILAKAHIAATAATSDQFELPVNSVADAPLPEQPSEESDSPTNKHHQTL